MLMPNSVGQFLNVLADHPETNTVRSVLNLILPALVGMDAHERSALLNQMPVSSLREMLNPDGAGWSQEIAASLHGRGFTSRTHIKHYPGVIRRFAELAGELSVPEVKVLKAFACWQRYEKCMELIYPCKKERLQALREAGVMSVGGYDIAKRSPERAISGLQNLRTRVRRLMRECRERGMSLKEFGDTIVAGTNFDLISCLVGKTAHYYDNQLAWNAIREFAPELELSPWTGCKPQVAIPAAACPDSLLEGIEEALFENHDIKESTAKNYRDSLMQFLGILEAEGLSLFRLTKGLKPRDALRLVTQSFPRELLTHDPEHDSPHALARRLIEDPDFRDKAIDMMRDLEGSYDGKAAVENPFVRIVLNARHSDEAFAAARQLIMRISYVNKNYFDIKERHYAWIVDTIKEVVAWEKDDDSDYDDKKRLAFQHPDLWLRIRDRLLESEEQLISQAANPTYPWASAVGRTALVHLLLLYPLRKANFNMLQIGEHFDPQTFEIHLERKDVKNYRDIDLKIPRRGLGRGCYEIMRLYLDVARPILLKGRKTNYLFVPDQTRPNSGLKLRKNALNDILKQFARQTLKDILPPGLHKLNPHLCRHVVASWALVVRKDLPLAAQLLGDDPKTVLDYYSDVLASAKDSLFQYYESDDKAPVANDADI